MYCKTPWKCNATITRPINQVAFKKRRGIPRRWDNSAKKTPKRLEQMASQSHKSIKTLIQILNPRRKNLIQMPHTSPSKSHTNPSYKCPRSHTNPSKRHTNTSYKWKCQNPNPKSVKTMSQLQGLWAKTCADCQVRPPQTLHSPLTTKHAHLGSQQGPPWN